MISASPGPARNTACVACFHKGRARHSGERQEAVEGLVSVELN
jgi:hypothetical protein